MSTSTTRALSAAGGGGMRSRVAFVTPFSSPLQRRKVSTFLTPNNNAASVCQNNRVLSSSPFYMSSSTEVKTENAAFFFANVTTEEQNIVMVETSSSKTNGQVVTNGESSKNGVAVNGAASSSSSATISMPKENHTVSSTGVNGVVNGDTAHNDDDQIDVPIQTENGGYSHTKASKAKISAANKGKTPWNKGKARSEEVRARISA
eukprot:13233379-Ditylum_brightwellii.AAC.1